MLQLILTLHLAVIDLGTKAADRLERTIDGRLDRGQTTAEYALVLLGAAAIAMLIVAWATKTNKVTSLLDKVLNSVAKLIP